MPDTVVRSSALYGTDIPRPHRLSAGASRHVQPRAQPGDRRPHRRVPGGGGEPSAAAGATGSGGSGVGVAGALVAATAALAVHNSQTRHQAEESETQAFRQRSERFMRDQERRQREADAAPSPRDYRGNAFGQPTAAFGLSVDRPGRHRP